MNKHISRLTLLLPILLTLTSASGQSREATSRVVVTSKQALLMLEPLLICQPNVIRFAVSSDGEGVLIERQIMDINPLTLATAMKSKTPQKMERQIVLYNATSRESKIVWRSQSPSVYIQQMEWMKNGDSGLFVTVDNAAVPGPDPLVLNGPRHEVYRVTSISQRALKVFETTGSNAISVNINFSPVEPLGFLTVDRYEKQSYKLKDGTTKDGVVRIPFYQVIRQDGKPGMVIQIEGVPDNSYLGWDSVGNPIFISSVPSPNGKGFKAKYYLLNPGNLAVKEMTTTPTMYVYKSVTPVYNAKWNVSLLSSVQRINSPEAKQIPIDVTWLMAKEATEKPVALVSSDSTNAAFMGTNRGIVFQSLSGLWHMPVAEIPLEDFKQMKSAAERTVALSNAKQAGLALIMYAQDYDEVFPTGDDINNKIMPYIKNQDILNSFAYTYGGGAISAITSPAETELGYVNGPGGKAIVYADGHAKWKSN